MVQYYQTLFTKLFIIFFFYNEIYFINFFIRNYFKIKVSNRNVKLKKKRNYVVSVKFEHIWPSSLVALGNFKQALSPNLSDCEISTFVIDNVYRSN